MEYEISRVVAEKFELIRAELQQRCYGLGPIKLCASPQGQRFELMAQPQTGALDRPYSITMASFSLTPLDGSNLIYSHAAWVATAYQGRGIGKRLNKLRSAVAASLNLCLFCTVNNTNIAEIACLLANGWRRQHGVDDSSSIWILGGRA